jgi:hypothetical protein
LVFLSLLKLTHLLVELPLLGCATLVFIAKGFLSNSLAKATAKASHSPGSFVEIGD